MAINEDRLFTIVLLVVMLTFIGFHKAQAAEPWEAGLRIGAFSNVYHSLDDEDGDWYVSPLLAYSNATKPKQGLAWTLQGVIDGYAYRDETDLNSVAATLTPGLWYEFDRATHMRIQPFVQIKTVNDSDQSASAYGGSVALDHQWSKTLGSGIYARYFDSHAHEHVYSADESALGVSLDFNLTSKWYGSGWFEYAHGSNYQSMTLTVPAANAWGWNLGYAGIYPFRDYNSQTVTIVLNSKQDTQSLGLRTGYAWTPRILTELNYVHRKADSDWGDVSSDEVSCGVYLRF